MRQTTFIGLAALCLCMSSCFKDEPLNAECDINSAWIHYDNPEECTWNLSDTIFPNINTSDSTITFRVKPQTDRTHLAPRFTLTGGALMNPANGSEHNFTQGPVIYKVTSEDGQWSKTYKVGVAEQHNTNGNEYYGFEHYTLFQAPNSNAQYYVWSDFDDNWNELNNWATGNAGFKISNGSANADEYPTVPEPNGRSGAAIKLVTRATGRIASAVKKPMAAGNLFLGSFESEYALKDAMKATRFGLPFDKKPLKLSGYYKYSPGETFRDANWNVIEGRTDQAAIYAILYRNHDDNGNAVVLYGDNVQTSGQIVAKAIMNEIPPTDEWTLFEVAFDYGGKELDTETLNSFGYSLTLVFSSSANGAFFRGAVGSTLCIDDVSVTCENKNQ